MSSTRTKTRTIWSNRLAGAVALIFAALPLWAAECFPLREASLSYTVCTADPASDDIRLFRTAPDGTVLGSFDRVNLMLGAKGDTLHLAMNGGMYHGDRSPVGLYIEDGVTQKPAVASDGPGNFGLLPNGIFCVEKHGAQVIETRAYLANPPTCRFATQSGPMLVIDGALHPRFLPDSTSRYIRNGVGVTATGTVVMAISEQPVTFHEFGQLFRDRLQTPNALYLDGKVSRLYAPSLGRNDIGLPLGPILGVVSPLPR